MRPHGSLPSRSTWRAAAAAVALLIASALLASGAASADTTPVADRRPATVTVPANVDLAVNDAAAADPNRRHLLASLAVRTRQPGEVRRVRLSLPIEHIRAGSAFYPDRFFYVTYIDCVAADTGALAQAVHAGMNILVNDVATLSPQLLVTFAEPGEYSCDFRYKLRTSRLYDDTTDDVRTRSAGAGYVSAPLPPWVAQCYWPQSQVTGSTGCHEYTADQASSAKVSLGEQLARTPTLVEVPHGTTFTAFSQANVTTCGGSGGAEVHLCGDDERSWIPSTVRSRLVLTALSAAPGCAPVLARDPGHDGVLERHVAVKTHHAMLDNTARWTTPADPRCPTRYRIENVLTVTEGSPIISHRLSTLLFVSPLSQFS